MIEICFPADWTWAQVLHWLIDRVSWCDGYWQNMRTNPVWITSSESWDLGTGELGLGKTCGKVSAR